MDRTHRWNRRQAPIIMRTFFSLIIAFSLLFPPALFAETIPTEWVIKDPNQETKGIFGMTQDGALGLLGDDALQPYIRKCMEMFDDLDPKVASKMIGETASLIGDTIGAFNIAYSALEQKTFDTVYNVTSMAITKYVSSNAATIAVNSNLVGAFLSSAKLAYDAKQESIIAQRGVDLEIFKYMVQFDHNLRPKGTYLKVDKPTIKYFINRYIVLDHKGGRAAMRRYVIDVLEEDWPDIFKKASYVEKNWFGTGDTLMWSNKRMDELRVHSAAFLKELENYYNAMEGRLKAKKDARAAKEELEKHLRAVEFYRKYFRVSPFDVKAAKEKLARLEKTSQNLSRDIPDTTEQLMKLHTAWENHYHALNHFALSLRDKLKNEKMKPFFRTAVRLREDAGKVTEKLSDASGNVWTKEQFELNKGTGKLRWPLKGYDVSFDGEVCISAMESFYQGLAWLRDGYQDGTILDLNKNPVDYKGYLHSGILHQCRDRLEEAVKERDELIPEHFKKQEQGPRQDWETNIKPLEEELAGIWQRLGAKDYEDDKERGRLLSRKKTLEDVIGKWNKAQAKWYDKMSAMSRAAQARINQQLVKCAERAKTLGGVGSQLTREARALVEPKNHRIAEDGYMAFLHYARLVEGLRIHSEHIGTYNGLADLTKVRGMPQAQDLGSVLSVLTRVQDNHNKARPRFLGRDLEAEVLGRDSEMLEEWTAKADGYQEDIESRKTAFARLQGGAVIVEALNLFPEKGPFVNEELFVKDVRKKLQQARSDKDFLEPKLKGLSNAPDWRMDSSFLSNLRARLTQLSNLGDQWKQDPETGLLYAKSNSRESLPPEVIASLADAMDMLLNSGSGQWLQKASPDAWKKMAEKEKLFRAALKNKRQGKAFWLGRGWDVTLEELRAAKGRLAQDPMAEKTWYTFAMMNYGLTGEFGKLHKKEAKNVLAMLSKIRRDRALEKNADLQKKVDVVIARVDGLIKQVRPGADDFKEKAALASKSVEDARNHPVYRLQLIQPMQDRREKLSRLGREHEKHLSGVSKQNIRVIKNMYNEFARAYQRRDAGNLTRFLDDDWEAADGTTIDDMEEILENSFDVFDRIDMTMTSLNVNDNRNGTFTAVYNTVVKGEIFDQDIVHEEKAFITDTITLTKKGPRIIQTKGGAFWIK